MKPLRLPLLQIALACATLAACASPPDRYYTLAGSTGTAPSAVTASPRLVIEVLPVTLPERLARPQMLVRQNGDAAEVAVLEQHRWSSSFESELRDALAAGLAERLGAIDASKAPAPGATPAWRIGVQVRRFELIENRQVDTSFAWTLRRSDEAVALTCQSDVAEPVGPGIEALAKGARRATGQVVRDIAAVIAATQADASVARRCPERTAN